MATERNRVYLQHPTQEGSLLPAQLLKEADGVLSIRLLEELLLKPNSETKQYYQDHNDLFYGFDCTVLRMESGGPNPVFSVKQTGPKERHENRETFRIPVYDDMLTGTVNGQRDVEVFDISYGGISIVTDYPDHVLDTWIDIELHFDCKTYVGRMQVRNRNVIKDGRFRYGLKVDPLNKAFVKDLENITQAMQKLKARRASRIGVNNKYAGRVVYEDESSALARKEAEENPQEKPTFDSPDGTNRKHIRKSWQGPARVYILEERQLRVLEVSTLDLSPGGLGFLSRQYIYEGCELLFEKAVPGGTFRVCGKVSNVQVATEGMHRVGIQFVGAPLKAGETHPKYYMV